MVLKACLNVFAKVFVYVLRHIIVIVAWLAAVRGCCIQQIGISIREVSVYLNSIEEFEWWVLTVTLFLQDPRYLLGWEVGHTVGPMLWGWELDVTVHSTCLNARMGG